MQASVNEIFHFVEFYRSEVILCQKMLEKSSLQLIMEGQKLLILCRLRGIARSNYRMEQLSNGGSILYCHSTGTIEID